MIVRARSTLGQIAAFLLLAICAAPLVALLAKAATNFSGEQLFHLGSTIVPYQLEYTLALTTGVIFLGAFLALGGACCALFDFPGRKFLQRILYLPLLLPTWFVTALYHERFGHPGLWHLIIVLSVSVGAPIFHLFATSALRTISPRYTELLSLVDRQHFIKAVVILMPLAMPALFAAAAVIFLQVLADAASARLMAVPTLVVGLFDQWFSRENDALSALLSLFLLTLSLLLPVIGFVVLKKYSWQDQARLLANRGPRLKLSLSRGVIIWCVSAPQLIAGILIPLTTMSKWALEALAQSDMGILFQDLGHSLLLGSGTTLGAILLALLIIFRQVDRPRSTFHRLPALLSAALFALPSPVLGLAFFILFKSHDDQGMMALLNQTAIPLIVALVLHFVGVLVISGQVTLLRRAKNHCQLMLTLGCTNSVDSFRLLGHYLRGPLSVAAAYVFLETLKDLSLSLLFQPFGFDTLASRLFQYVQTQRLPECASWILGIFLLGIYPLYLLASHGDDHK